MELMEGIEIGINRLLDQEPSCANNPDNSSQWKARVNGPDEGTYYGELENECSGQRLWNNLDANRESHEQKNLGVVPTKHDAPNDYWGAKQSEQLTGRDFPCQAHHLIPKNHLPTHSVCMWLCKKYAEQHGQAQYELEGDTFYDTDHSNNGYAMPWATQLKDWNDSKNISNASDRETKQIDIKYRVMDKTGIQIHQSDHPITADHLKINNISKRNTFFTDTKKFPTKKKATEAYRYSKSEIAERYNHKLNPTDAMKMADVYEESNIHSPGYKNPISVWLNAVGMRIQQHVEGCDQCKSENNTGRTKIKPLADSVKMMNQVSYIAKVFMTLDIIFASYAAAAYAKNKGRIRWDASTKKYVINQNRVGVENELGRNQL